jgi:cytosine/adenosine deaminase-related metal-dependent hydrolase
MKNNQFLLRAGHLIVDSKRVIKNGALVVDNGRIKWVGLYKDAPSTGHLVDIGDGVVHPGFINAHCHTDLSFAKGKIKKQGSFTGWIEQVIKARRSASIEDVQKCAEAEVRNMISNGITCVGDVALSFSVPSVLAKSGIRAVIYHEVLGADPESAKEKMNELEERIKKSISSLLVTNGISPHAIYSTSTAIYTKAAKMKMPMASHICETVEEIEYARYGKGDFRAMLNRFGIKKGLHPSCGPVRAIEKSGALSGMSAVHMNRPMRGDIGRLVKAKASILYCPASNGWFDRDDNYPLRQYLRHGINVALGTDSLASNDSLDIAKEARLVKKLHPEVTDEHIFEMATVNGAKALQIFDGTGTLCEGAPFDAVAVESSTVPKNIYRSIMRKNRQTIRVWVEGRELYNKGSRL